MILGVGRTASSTLLAASMRNRIFARSCQLLRATSSAVGRRRTITMHAHAGIVASASANGIANPLASSLRWIARCQSWMTASSRMHGSSIAPTRSPPVFGMLRQIMVDRIISPWIVLIKRTFQPSLIRKKRKCGYLKRRRSKDGRKIFLRRRAKGRARLFGA